MLCPFCLKENTIKKIEDRGRSYYVCSEHPDPIIPIIYAEKKIPTDVISAIGFPAHGKSVYFTSLFSSLDALASPNVWPHFFTLPVNEQALDTINDNVKLLKGGKLPGKTPMTFPLPTIVQFSNMPRFKERFLIFFDTSGESYKKASTLIKNASFVTRSQTVIFFISLYDLEYNPQEMTSLLWVYIQGLKELGGNLKQQHLLVVLTKGDLLASKLESRKQIWDYLVNGDVKNIRYSDINSQMAEMKKISKLLKDFLIEDVGASMFISLGKEYFRNVEFCIISALGSAPKGDQLDISSTPKRIFDPILWVMNNSTGWIPFFFNLINSSTNFIKSKIKALITLSLKIKKTIAKIPSVKPIFRKVAKYGAITLILALIILLVLYLNIIPIPPPVSSPDPYDTAFTLQNEQKYQEALNAYENVPATNPNYIYALTNKGNILTHFKRYDEALIEYNKALVINPNYQSAIDGKKKVQEKIDMQNPETVKQMNNLKIQELIKKGEALVKAEQYQEALDVFDQALAIGTTDNNIEKKLLGEKVFVLNKMGRVLEANNIAQTIT